MITHETDGLLTNIIKTVRDLENKKSQLGDQSSLYIKNVTIKLKQNNVPPVELVFTNYVDELGCDIDFWVKWDGKMFLTSMDSNDDYSPILGQKIQDRFNFVKFTPSILKDMEDHFKNEAKEMDFFVEDINFFKSKKYDEDEDEMSEADKDFMMMDGIED